MQRINFNPFPVLETKRLILRQLEITDDDEIFSIRNNDQINKYLKRSKQESIVESIEFILKINKGISNNEWIYWAVTFKSKPGLIGTICFWNFSEDRAMAEIGYELTINYQGQGIMNEAVKCVLDFGFNCLGFEAIKAYTDKENQSSIDLLKRNNFKLSAEIGLREKTNELFFMKYKESKL